MRCSKCGADNREGRRFCAKCAAPLARSCPQCGASNEPGEDFCGECGAPLGKPSAPSAQKASNGPLLIADTFASENLEGERKTVTTLFADIKGSMDLIEDLDPEDARAIVDPALKLMIDAVHHYEGYVAQSTGDGIFALFGAPVAHEDDPQRALHAALRMQEHLHRHSAKQRELGQTALEARIGIHTGEVVVRTIQTAEGRSEYAPVGHPVGLAARMQALAPPGSIAATEATRKLCEGYFNFRSLGPTTVRGVNEAVTIYEVTGLGPLRTRLQRSAARGLTRFIGRDDEMRTLWNRWEVAREGEGQVVAITGEAGIGKSRVIHQFHERLAGSSVRWIEGAAESYFQTTPFHAVVAIVNQAFGLKADQNPDERLDRLEKTLKQHGIDAFEAVAVLAQLLNLPVGERYLESKLPPERARKRLLGTLTKTLLAQAASQPMVLAVEDLHWADASTLEFLELLVEQPVTAPVMVLVTARPDFHAPWPMRPHHTVVTLNRLSSRDVREMIAQVGGSRLGRESVDTITERTSGVPLFVEELTRAVLESGDLRPGGREIPATLADSLMARLDRLGSAKEIAQIGAVIGSSFSHELIAGVYDGEPDELQDALQRLIDSDLLHTTGAAPEVVIYHFKHTLVQDTAYAALLKSRRRELHRRTAYLIAERLPQTATEHPEVLARHWTGAGELEKALTAWSSAGRVARKRRAFREAERAYQHALEVIGKLPESPERDALELPVVGALAQLSELTHGYAAAQTKNSISRALALVRKIGNVGQLSLQLAVAWAPAINGGDYRSADALSREFIELAEREGNPMNLALAHMMRIETHFYLGELAEAERCFERGRAFFEDQVFKQFPGALVTALAFASLTAFATGRIETALTRIDEAARFVQQCNNPYDRAFVSYQNGALKLLIGEPAEAIAPAREAINLSDEHGFPHIAAAARTTMGGALANCGEPGQGVQLIEESLNAFRETETRMAVSLSLFYLAQAQALQGATDKALHTIERALEANPDEIIYRPEVLRLRGEFRMKVGDREQAAADFGEAITCAHAMGAKAFELRATTSLARLLRDTNRRDEARRMLADVYNWFTESFETANLKDAKTLLDELSN